MAILDYDEYIRIVPEETKSFIKTLLNHLNNKSEIGIDGHSIIYNNSLLFIKALCAYSSANEKSANAARQAGFTYSNSYWSGNCDDQTKRKLFTEYYDVLAPYKEIEKYYTLTPEEILRSIYNKRLYNQCSYPLTEAFNCDVDTFFKRINKISNHKKNFMMNEIMQHFNKDYSVDVINYFDTSARLFCCLEKDKENIKDIETDDETLSRLAMILSVFIYQGVITKEGVPTDKEIIVSYLEQNGITIEDIEAQLNIVIDKYDLSKVDPTLILAKNFSKNFLSGTSKQYTTVSKLFGSIAFNPSNLDNLPIIKLLSNLSGHELKLSDFESFVSKEKEKPNDSSLNDFLKNLMPNVLTFIRRVIRVYTYLESVEDTLDKKYIQTDKDLILAAIILVSYGYNNKYTNYFEEHGMTIDKVLELLNLPAKEEYLKNLKDITIDMRKALLFKDFINGGYNYNRNRSAITPESIIFNIDDNSKTKSSLVHKLFHTTTDIHLPDNFQSRINEYDNKKEKDRRLELTENLLGEVDISVYNFLRVVSNYYISLTGKGLDEVDHEQLSIILAAIKFDRKLCNYLYNIGITEGNLPDRFSIRYEYYDKPFDIDIINEHFKPYIFDREPKDITMYTIFENAFNPALKNSINLRKALFSYNKTPEDFIGIEAKITEFEKNQEIEEQINKLYNKLNDRARPIVQTAFKIHKYLVANMSKIKIITSIEDIKELSMLIGFLVKGDSYKPFFANNGITLEGILKLINLNSNTFKEICDQEVDKSLSLEYKKYLTKAVSAEDLIEALFNDLVNNSKIIENITTTSGNNYTFLVEEVKNKKERVLSPEQGIEILSAEEVKALNNLSFSSVVSYGSDISIHSKYISDALQQLVFADSLEHSTEELNKLLEEISYTEEVPSEEKQSFFTRLFALEEPTKTVKKYDPTKIENMGPQIDIQTITLSKELKGYEALKKYIEVYLIKLNQYLKELKRNYAILESQPIDESLDEIIKFAKTLDKNSALEILRDKIQSFETIILLMKQELVTVHRAIINHFLAVNSLQTSKMAILPLISSEMAISAGNATESETLKLTGELVNLLQNVVNKNAEGTRENLTRLRSSSISEETYQALNAQVNSYLDSVDRGQRLLSTELTVPKPNVIDSPVTKDDEPTEGTSNITLKF